MCAMVISGPSYEEALAEAVRRASLPENALVVREVSGLGELIDDRKSAQTVDGVTIHVSVAPEHIADAARDHLVQLLRLMEIQAEVRSSLESNYVKLQVRAADGALLIGRGGQTLEALQHIINRIACPPDMDAPFVSIDVEEYREKRLSRLEQIARRGAREAINTREEVVLEPMSRADRKIVHMTLRANPAIRTFSRGEEGERSVVVAPAQSDPR